MILDEFIANNEAPVLVIGAGLTHRYYEQALCWEGLLIEIATQLNITEEEFYRKLSSFKNNTDEPFQQTDFVKFQSYKRMASFLQEAFDSKYYEGNLKLENYTSKQIFDENFSPMKIFVSQLMKGLQFRQGLDQEREAFSHLLMNCHSIFTTNYDTMIEDFTNGSFKCHTRQSDLYLSNDYYGQIYKIHGSVEEPATIVITEKDYIQYQENSLLIVSKLVTLMLESPIIFIGYSFTDDDILQIINKFSSCLSVIQRNNLKNRLVLVVYEKGKMDIEDSVIELSGGKAQISILRTDNFLNIYEKLNQIEQGLKPSQVRAFQEQIRKIIIENGKQGNLKSVLISPEDLYDPTLDDRHLVVAIGNEKEIQVYPNRHDFFKEFIGLTSTFNSNVALKFVANQSSDYYFPFLKFFNSVALEDTSLIPKEKEHIKLRIQKHTDLIKERERIPKQNRIPFSSLYEILKENCKIDKLLDIISYNIDNINLSEVAIYLKSLMSSPGFETPENKYMTQLGRLLVLFDIYQYKYSGNK
jgi:hypothetical protein